MVGVLFILAAFVVFIVAATLVFQWRMRKHRGVAREECIATFAEAAIPTENLQPCTTITKKA
jgi:flagellar basal body-associated protein FliL